MLLAYQLDAVLVKVVDSLLLLLVYIYWDWQAALMWGHRPGAMHCVHGDPGCLWCLLRGGGGLPHVRGLCLLEHVPVGQDGEDNGDPQLVIWGQKNMAWVNLLLDKQLLVMAMGGNTKIILPRLVCQSTLKPLMKKTLNLISDISTPGSVSWVRVLHVHASGGHHSRGSSLAGNDEEEAALGSDVFGHNCSPVDGVLGQAELHDHGEAGPNMAHTIPRRILVRNKSLECCVLA